MLVQALPQVAGEPLPLPSGQFVALPQPAPTPTLATPQQISNPATPLPITPQTPAPITPQIPELPANPPALLGQVTGFTQSGQPIISLALPGSGGTQNYAMQFVANNIIEGSPIIVTPLPHAALEPKIGIVPFGIGASQNLADWAQGDTWESLQNLMTSVNHLNPALAAPLVQMLPTAAAPQNLGALSLFFLSMMRTGDLETWINEPTAALLKETGKIDILRQLSGDVAMSNKFEASTMPNDWRGIMLPFWNNGQVNKLPLYYKQWSEENDADENNTRRKKTTRFLFELKLSRMGQVQVDGFMKQEKLDMILRTKSIISANMQQALKITYTKAMERSNLSGEITFQFKPEQWVNIEVPA